mmetsp:Transcript_17689/g.43119  ORF Transcript_17689/g.43119 Transcript_17689/m.43119 type:complete len:221 (-) Transcript_17689:1729-2391(-)
MSTTTSGEEATYQYEQHEEDHTIAVFFLCFMGILALVLLLGRALHHRPKLNSMLSEPAMVLLVGMFFSFIIKVLYVDNATGDENNNENGEDGDDDDEGEGEGDAEEDSMSASTGLSTDASELSHHPLVSLPLWTIFSRCACDEDTEHVDGEAVHDYNDDDLGPITKIVAVEDDRDGSIQSKENEIARNRSLTTRNKEVAKVKKFVWKGQRFVSVDDDDSR